MIQYLYEFTADSEPLSLKEICRSVIRIQLRRRAEADNPMIVLKSGSKNRQMLRKNKSNESGVRARRSARMRNRRVIIPIFEESDDTNSNTSQRHTNGDNSNDSFSSRVVAAAASSISAVFQQVVNSHESDNNSNDSKQKKVETEEQDIESKDKTKCEEEVNHSMELEDNDSEERDLSATIERTKRSISITGIPLKLFFDF